MECPYCLSKRVMAGVVSAYCWRCRHQWGAGIVCTCKTCRRVGKARAVVDPRVREGSRRGGAVMAERARLVRERQAARLYAALGDTVQATMGDVSDLPDEYVVILRRALEAGNG